MTQKLNFAAWLARSLLQGSGWTENQMSRFAVRLARQLLQRLIASHLGPNSGEILANSRFQGADWTCCQRIKSASCWVKSLVPNSDWIQHQNVGIEGYLAKSLVLDSDWIPTQKSSCVRCLARHSCKALVEVRSKCQCFQAGGKSYSFEALVELHSKSQALQIAWQNDSLETFVKLTTKRQT